jgi:hypothetical protein
MWRNGAEKLDVTLRVQAKEDSALAYSQTVVDHTNHCLKQVNDNQTLTGLNQETL